jgi:hypothetical protein
MRRLLHKLQMILIDMTGAGAVANARLEVDRVAKTTANLDAQLGRLQDTTQRRAA